MNATLLASVGLGMDAVGVLLLFFYGLPSRVSGPPFHGAEARVVKGDVYESDKYKVNKRKFERAVRRARFGLLLMIGGFWLQIVSNYL